jgi:prepilin-type N-terminal cleavage/methylation domain-containing protein/prepilin-type processing-associated H-X9-DG protein
MFSSRTSDGDLKRGGFTLVELLVVITIIGILIGMLLPAVNAARESGRNAQCKNNLKQLGTACLGHEEAQGIFPTGGWGWFWVGDPDRGYGDQQPGGWIYNILPHTEQSALHDWGRYGTTTDKKNGILQLVKTPLSITNCPTRRRPAVFPMAAAGLIAHNSGGVTATAGFPVARTDYAINCGDLANDQYSEGPANETVAAQNAYFGTRKTDNIQTYHGISFEQSTIRKDDVKDGLSQTILVGEKYLSQDAYGTGGSGADNENQYAGFDNDIGRTTYVPPMQDRWGKDDGFAFGSAHPNSANFVLCDGSVIAINYTVNADTFLHLGTRDSGDMVDMSKL